MISSTAATEAIADQTYAKACWEDVKSQRRRVTEELQHRGFKVLPSQANFVLATCPQGDGVRLYRSLKDRGIFVRFFNSDGLRDKLRVSIGTSDQNTRFFTELDKILVP